MKWGVGIVVVIIAGAFYYFWTESHFQSRQNVGKTPPLVSEPRPPQQEKYIPPSAIMEDGTI